MADKELRKMNRTELIEIIYALQQNERTLRTENEKLRRQLDDKLLRMESAGSIAEAAMSLNHVFEDAEAAARQYLDSLRYVDENVDKILSEARQQADQIVAAARQERTAQEPEPAPRAETRRQRRTRPPSEETRQQRRTRPAPEDTPRRRERHLK
ncbi:MAG: hypothetical protein LUE21_09730 [Oscillospiraceae bacterium]|nr:hypothetical protein [Oscillospiraceae bacterium]